MADFIMYKPTEKKLINFTRLGSKNGENKK